MAHKFEIKDGNNILHCMLGPAYVLGECKSWHFHGEQVIANHTYDLNKRNFIIIRSDDECQKIFNECLINRVCDNELPIMW